MLRRDDVVYEFGRIRVDPHKRTVGFDGRNVPLPSRAFDVLLLLAMRHGELVSKAELLATIWPDTHVEEANLPVMISAIRKAIGDDGRSQKYIQTVSKCGYRLIGEVREIRVIEPEPPVTPILAVAKAVPTLAQAQSPALRRWDPRFTIAAGFALATLAALLLAGGSTIAGHGVLASPAVSSELNNHPARPQAQVWLNKGRYAWNLQTRDGILRSIEYYKRAVAEEGGGFASAWAGLAEAYVILPSYSERLPAEDRGRARIAAMKAAALDDDLADTHVALGMVSLIDDRNFGWAEREFRKAIALDPSLPLAQGELGLCLVSTGRTEEAVVHARQAKALDPLSIRAATDLGIVLYYGRRFTEAEAEFEEVLKLDPYSYRAHVNLGKTYLSLGRFDEARRVLEEASALSNHDPLAEGLTAEAEALQGDTAGAKSILATLQRRAGTSYVAPISFAFAFIGLGRLDDALVCLRNARADRAIAALYLNVDPNWDSLHGKPEFRSLVKDISLTANE